MRLSSKMILARLFLPLLLAGLAFPQPLDNEKIWEDFVSWVRAQRDMADVGSDKYYSSLIQSGLTPAQAGERMATVGKLYPERRKELADVYMNKLYASPKQTRFTLEPNAFLAQTAKGLKPGRALDIAMGQGRNAVHLATLGWDVTGYDIADEGLRIANGNAAKAGVRIQTVHATFEDFDYGKQRWDLIYLVYTDAPVVDSKFAERICSALKPGGYLLIERPFRDLDNPDLEWSAPLIEQD
jgi:SAM-dependent methyltransferase